jgi:hypothetical protein
MKTMETRLWLAVILILLAVASLVLIYFNLRWAGVYVAVAILSAAVAAFLAISVFRARRTSGSFGDVGRRVDEVETH